MAMKIGGEYRPEWIAIRHWERFAEHTGIHSKLVLQTLRKMTEKITTEAALLKGLFDSTYGENDAVNSISSLIASRVKKVLIDLDRAS